MRLQMKIFLAMLLGGLALAAPDDALADTIVARCDGQTQGELEGDATMQNFEGWMNVFGFGHGVVVPFDSNSGQRGGQRRHQPLRLYKAIDKATPKLYRALVTGERVDCEVRFFQTSRQGTVVNYFTIELQNGFLSDITAASGSEGAGTREVVSIVYQQITWTYENGGITTTDDWSSLPQ
jgi:type VI secretion system secreted protein Hcp